MNLQEEKRSSIIWFTHKMAAKTGAGPVQSWKSEAAFGSPLRVLGPKDLGHLSLIFQFQQQGTGSAMGQQGLEPVSIRDAGTVGRCLMH